MKILLTGGFGTVGLSILENLLTKGHEITIFEIKNRRNLSIASKYSKRRIHIIFGDIRNLQDIEKAISGQDVIIHCAAILPPTSDINKKLCYEINVEGTRNLANSIIKNNKTAPLIYISSASVMGPTQDREPPVKVSDEVNPVDNYAYSKVEAEKIVRLSGIRFCILRLGAVMPRNLLHLFRQFRLAFEIPVRARCEVVLDSDVAFACVNAAVLMSNSNAIDGATFFIGGGKQNGCQINAYKMYEGIFKPIGVDIPPASLFSDNINNYYIDWYDTEKAQQILKFQNHTFDDYSLILKKKYFLLIPLIIVLRPLINLLIRSQSPYK